MNSSTQRTYDQVFQHPMTHSLEWRDVRSMFEALGKVEEQHNGNLKVSMAGNAFVIKSPSSDGVATCDEVSRIRRILLTTQEQNRHESGHHILIVIDHQGARVFRREIKGTVPERVTPYDPRWQKEHVHSPHDFERHDGSPNQSAYYAAIAKQVADSDLLLIFGSGSGSSSAMDAFVAWLAEHRPSVSERIVGAITVDASHLTDDQLLAKARDIYDA